MTFVDGKVTAKVMEEPGGKSSLPAVASSADPTATLLQAMQGTWKNDKVGTDGSEVTYTVSGHTMHWNSALKLEGGGTFVMPDQTISIDANHSPAWIDVGNGGDVMLGVVEVDGDTWKQMLSFRGVRRPGNFDDFTGDPLKSQVETAHRVR